MTTKSIHLDELRTYAVRDPQLLKPGQRVIFCHVPPLARPDLASSKARPYGFEATTLEVAAKTFLELHPNTKPMDSDEPKLVIFYESEHGKSYTYASDSGVVPYHWGHEFYNDTNFLVIEEQLRAAGLEPLLEVSAAYEEELKDYNARVDTSYEDSLNDYYAEDRY